jgi:hypothetical protein
MGRPGGFYFFMISKIKKVQLSALSVLISVLIYGSGLLNPPAISDRRNNTIKM